METNPVEPFTRKFQKLLPSESIGQAKQRNLWVDPSGLRKITAGDLRYDSKGDAFIFDLLSVDTSHQAVFPKLVRLLLAKKELYHGRDELHPTGETVWINPEHIFAIGSLLGGTMLWIRPEKGGEFRCLEDNSICVLISGDSKNSFTWAPESTPQDVAKLLRIELADKIEC